MEIVNMRTLDGKRAVREGRAVRIDRATIYGNPFVIGPDGDRAEVIARYRDWLAERPDIVAKARRELAGKDVACWCAPQACHGEILREFIGRAIILSAMGD